MGGERMSLFSQKKTIDRLNQMIDNAIDGKNIEQGFDEIGRAHV